MFTFSQMNIIAFCASEVERQEDKPMMVYKMLHAWNFVSNDLDFGHRNNITRYQLLTPEYVAHIGTKVHPYRGFIRKSPVVIDNRVVGVGHEAIPRAMENLFNPHVLGRVLTPTQVYIEFEKIHPFEDGNGRVGVILFNALNGTMDRPVWPRISPKVFE